MNTLEVGADSSWLLHAAAAAILYLHMAAGTVALLSGGFVLATRKGGRSHARMGTVFFASMLLMASIGALVAPFLFTPQGDRKLLDSLVGFFTCYLVASSWITVRRKAGTIGHLEKQTCVLAVALAAAALFLGLKAAGTAGGVAGGASAAAFYVLGLIIALAAAMDLRMILRGGVKGAPRLARHLWRMCAALFIAAGAFFLGLQRVMPDFVQGSPFLAVPPLTVLAVMAFWLLRLRFARPLNDWKKMRSLRGRAAASLVKSS